MHAERWAIALELLCGQLLSVLDAMLGALEWVATAARDPSPAMLGAFVAVVVLCAVVRKES